MCENGRLKELTMKIIYVHHALREVGNPPSQNDDIQPLGINDAENTAELLKIMSDKSKSTFRAIYTSPFYRCVKTAEIINEHINLPIYEDARFNEFVKVFEVLQGEKNITKTEAILQGIDLLIAHKPKKIAKKNVDEILRERGALTAD